MSILTFLNNVLGLPGRFNFIYYVIAGVLLLILLDGIVSFLFGAINGIVKK